MNKPNRQPNAPTTSVPSTPLIEDEGVFVQQVWETTYSACLAAILSTRAGMSLTEDKWIIRDIHRALELANIAKTAAVSYIENAKQEAVKKDAVKNGDPLSKLVGTEEQP